MWFPNDFSKPFSLHSLVFNMLNYMCLIQIKRTSVIESVCSSMVNVEWVIQSSVLCI